MTAAPAAGNGKKVLKIILRILAVLLVFLLIVGAALAFMIKMILGSTSPKAKEILTTTLLETGQLKFIVSMFLDEKEIQEIVDRNKMEDMGEVEIDDSLINIGGGGNPADPSNNEKDIEGIEITGRT